MMMRSGNFATAFRPHVKLVATSVWLVVLISGFVLLWLLNNAAKLEEQAARLVKHSEALQVEYIDMEVAIEIKPPTAEITNALAAEIEYFNTLSGERRAPILEVFELLEAHIPAEVWLQQLSYNIETGRLQIALLSDQESALPPVLKALENIAGFSNVILERQIRLQGNGTGLVQYDVEAMVD